MIMETIAVVGEWLRLATTHQVIGKKAHDARLAALCSVENLALLTFNISDFRRFGILAVSPGELWRFRTEHVVYRILVKFGGRQLFSARVDWPGWTGAS